MSSDIEEGEYHRLPRTPPRTPPRTLPRTPPRTPLLSWLLFDISSPVIGYWKLLIAIFSIVISWVIPYHVGFVQEFTTWWMACDLISTGFIALDFFIFLNTSYVDKISGLCVHDRCKIIRNYGILGFLDLISIWPFTFTVLFFPRYGSIAKCWMMIRLVHVRKIDVLLSRLTEVQCKRIKTVIKWIKLICVTFLSLHFMGCLFYLVAKTNANIKRTWLFLADDETKKETNQGFFLYVMALYWATTVFSTVGYGDLHPVNGLEMGFNSVCMLCNTVFSSYVGKKVDGLLFATDHQTTKNLENVQTLKKFVGFQNLAKEFQEEICGLLSEVKDSPTSLSNILRLLPKNTQVRFRRSAFTKLIRKVYFFNGVSQCLLLQLVSEVEIETLPSDMVLIHKNEYPDKIYILVEGAMSRSGQTTSLGICGELGAFALLPQPYTVSTTMPCTLLSLSRIRLEQLVQVNKRDGDVIARNVIQDLTRQQQDSALQPFLRLVENKIDRGEIVIPLSVRFAVKRSNPRLLQQLMRRGDDLEDVYDDNQTILHIVANGEGTEACLAVLLEHVNLEQRDAHDKIALNYAITKGKGSVVDLFENRGAILPVDQFRQLLVVAMSSDKSNVPALLRNLGRFGGDMNTVLDDGKTPLHAAIYSGKKEVVEVLIELGADVNKRNAGGESPLDWARVKGGDMLKLFPSTSMG